MRVGPAGKRGLGQLLATPALVKLPIELPVQETICILVFFHIGQFLLNLRPL